MKKTFALLLALMLLLAPLSAWAEGEETPPPPPEYEPLPEAFWPLSQQVPGDWFADFFGLEIRLILGEEGAYALFVPGSEPLSGVWEVRDGLLIMDGDEDSPVLFLNDTLRMEEPDLLFTRERPLVYTPAEPLLNASASAYDGFWKVQFVAVGEGTVLAAALGENTELYIEGTKLAVNGTLLGLRQFETAFADGALTFATDRGIVALQLLQDGFLRLTLFGEAPATLYLMAKPLPGQNPAGA